MKPNLIALFLILLLAGCEVGTALADEIRWDDLIVSIIEIESNGNPNAISEDGCIGLMQISPIVLEEYLEYLCEPLRHKMVSENEIKAIDKNIGDLFDKNFNIKIGTWYLHRLHEHYGCKTIEQILMAYNGGIGNCRKNNFDIKKSPKETQNYVKKVLKLYNK